MSTNPSARLSARVARTVLAVLAVAPLLVIAPTAGQAQPQPRPAASRMRIDLIQLEPRVATATTPLVTVRGTVTNTGDRTVENLEVRLQRGDVLADESAVREAITNPARSQAVTQPVSGPSFQKITNSLNPGERAEFTVTASLSGPERESLKVTKTGVYGLVVNVNGKPDYSRKERVGALSLLLPVLSLPAGNGGQPAANGTRLGLLWPLLDLRPRRLETPADGTQTVLSDDDLSRDLAVGGRLFDLADAVEMAAKTNPNLRKSLCFVLDPDLLETVSAMSKGYLVRAPTGERTQGRGATAAQLWLAKVRDLVTGQCVIAVPFADADLVSLSRAGAAELPDLAVGPAASQDKQSVEKLVGTKPVVGAVWPAGGSMDQRSLSELSATRTVTAIVDPTRLRDASGFAPYALTGPTPAGASRVVPYDQLVSTSLSTNEDGPDIRTAAIQNTVATLVFRGAFQSQAGQTVLVSPPRRWTASASELAVLLSTVGQLHNGFAIPLDVQNTLTEPDHGAATLDYTPADSAAEIPQSVAAEVNRINLVLRELLTNVLFEDDTRKVEPADLLAPMRLGLLRAVSTAWRPEPQRAGLAAQEVDTQLREMLDKVSVTNPGRALSLASKDSPIPVYATNRLPVTVQAKINLGDTPGLRPEQSIVVVIPAGLGANRLVQSEVTRAGRFSVDVWLSTDSGTRLGGTARVELSSTSYGNITLVITGIAAGALVLLVGLRLFRKIRARRAAAAAADTAEL